MTTFTYDQRGMQLSRTLPLGQSEAFTYNDRGQMVTHTSFEGVVTAYEYDASSGSGGRLLAKHYFADASDYSDYLGNPGAYPPAESTEMVYDAKGRMIEVTDPSGTTSYQFDNQGRTTRVTSPEGVINYEYDRATGRKTRMYTALVSDPDDAITDTLYSYEGRKRNYEKQCSRARMG